MLHCFFFALICLVSATTAVTITYDETTAIRSTIYSALAYAKEKDLHAWDLPDKTCFVKGFVLDEVFYNAKEAAQGFIGVNVENKQVVLAFRGTNNVENMIEDLQSTFSYHTPCVVDGVSLGNTHKGFCRYYNSLNGTDVASRANELLTLNPTYQLLVTGHSLGASVAAIAAAHIALVLPGSNPLMYTIGEPRAGDTSFVEVYEQGGVNGFRVVHRLDPVPHIPPCCEKCNPKPGCPFHQATEIYYSDEAMNLNGTSPHTTCEWGEDLTCDKTASFPDDTDDHGFYFGYDVGHMCQRSGKEEK